MQIKAINTQKTKMMMSVFETSFLQKACGRQYQPSPVVPPFHMYTPFPTSDPRFHLIAGALQFEYLGLLLKLTMHLATTGAIRRATQGQSIIQNVSYSIRYVQKNLSN